MESLIVVDELTRVARQRGLSIFKRPEKKILLNNVSLEVTANGWFIILGKNGSGKSTLLKCLSGILNPTSGTVKVFGLNPWKNRIQVTRRMGILFGQKSMLFPDLRVVDSLRLYQKVYGVCEEQFTEMVNFADQFLSTNRLLEKHVRRMSFGERMRCELLSVILHKPQLLILDEPFVGLDPIAQQGLFEFLNTYQQSYKATIVMTTHQFLQSLEGAEQVLVLDSGHIRYNGVMTDLFMGYANRKEIKVQFSASLPSVMTMPGVTTIKAEGNRYVFDVNTSITSTKKFLDQLSSQHDVLDLEVAAISVERMVEELYANPYDSVGQARHTS